jgi:tetratricopeptide (TPR) repeat protein
VKGKILVIALAVIVLGVVAVVVVARSGRQAEWTTRSPQALDELQKGLDSLQKLYYNEAYKHFEKAAELDPGFVIAKRFLLATMQRPSSDPEVKKLYAELEKADLSKLTPREAFLVTLSLADHAKDTAKALQILHDYAARYPDDPFSIEPMANVAAARQDWPESRQLLSHLIEVAPNRVVAYNQLGYLEMGLGRFEEAEKLFQTYKYIAPDQANPHDSLAELFILNGRYDDAKRELDEALKVRLDFCPAYQHLVMIGLMDGRLEDAKEAIARAEKAGACPAFTVKTLRCQLAVWSSLVARDWPGVWNDEQTLCGDESVRDPVLALWAALATGRRTDAEAAVAKVREELAKMPASAPGRRYAESVLAHLEGALFLAQGKAAEAAERFRFADEGTSYRELGNGVFKLFNRHVLALALTASGNRQEGDAVLAEARTVNRRFMDRLDALAIPLPSD